MTMGVTASAPQNVPDQLVVTLEHAPRQHDGPKHICHNSGILFLSRRFVDLGLAPQYVRQWDTQLIVWMHIQVSTQRIVESIPVFERFSKRVEAGYLRSASKRMFLRVVLPTR